MGLYEEQIKERISYDDRMLEDVYAKMTSSVTGKKSESILNDHHEDNGAIEVILNYYGIKDIAIPSSITDLDEKLEYVCQPNGIMRRRIKLDEKWYKNAYGTFLGTLKDSGEIVAMIPAHPSGYKYYDSTTQSFVKIDKNNSKLIDDEAYTFYRPFPLRKMNVADLISYVRRLISLEDVLLIIALYLIVTLFGMLTPKFTSILYGSVVDTKAVSLLLATGIFMIMAGISSTMVESIQSIVMDRINTKMSICVESATMMRIFSLPVGFFRDYTSGELSSILGNVNSLCSMLINTVLSTSLTSLFSLLYITQVFKYAPLLVFPSIIIVVVTIVFNIFTTISNMKRSEKEMKYSMKTSGISYSLISGIQKIKLSGAEKRAFAKWGESYAKEAAMEYNPPMFLKVNSVISSGISLVGTIIMYYLAVKSGVSLGEYAAFNAAFGMVSGAFLGLSSIVFSIANFKPTYNICKPILDAVPENSENKEVLSGVRGDIRIDNVSFRYNDNMPQIFEDFSLKINHGQYVAIVGKTGCGKSTLIRLLLGFETPQKGAIYVDGKDISRVDLKSLRRHIGTVMQDGKAFQGDIFSNIVISAPYATLDDAWEAARLAGFDKDIESFPMGMNTIISEGSGGISGGQRQRMLIARALAPKPNLLIFDEATSALDNVTQKKVSDALDGLHCTRIVIAHRLSTIKKCDRIIVLDDGAIVEEGTYDELIAQNGFFKKLVERQQVEDEE